jgi:hypothetical protein
MIRIFLLIIIMFMLKASLYIIITSDNQLIGLVMFSLFGSLLIPILTAKAK